MKRLIVLFLAALFCCTSYAQQLSQDVITNNTMVTTWSDSFGLGQFGQRQNFFLGSYFINYYPQHFVSYRDHSRSGGANDGMLEGLMPEYGIPDAFANFGLTNGLNIFYVSGNGGFSSNSIYGFFKQILQYPTNSYTTNVSLGLTNDWPQANAQFLYSSIVIGDIAYANLSTDSRDRSYGGRSAAREDGVPFVDTWSNTIPVVTANNSDQNVLWFPNGGAFDHPDDVYQCIWFLSTLTYPTNAGGLGVDTNTFTAIMDFTAGTASATNHCTISSISRMGNKLNFTFHADRMAPGFYVPDGTTTNDCRGAFTLMPSLGNAFCEIWRLTNLPTGLYRISYDGYTNLATSAQLAAGYNWFTNYNNPLQVQKMAVLYGMCDLRDVLHTDNVTPAHSGNVLINNFESNARTVWPTNSPNVANYSGKMIGRPFNATTPTYDLESPELQNDIAINASAQQTSHPVTIELITPPITHLRIKAR